LEFQKPFLHELVASLAEYFKDSFPELEQQKEFVAKVIREEEASFFRTLSTGVQKLQSYFAENPGQGISGNMAFELYDTYGFPIDLTEIFARENKVSVDLEGFESALLQQIMLEIKKLNILDQEIAIKQIKRVPNYYTA
jgi:alanyl-tRNA synthetase